MPVAVARRRAVAGKSERPPPLKGWNARDPITAMKPGYAVRLDNWVCRSDGLHLRPGKERWVSLLNGPVHSLMSWGGVGSFQRVFAATPTAIYDVTTRRPVNFEPVSADSTTITADSTSITADSTRIPVGTAPTAMLSGLTSGVWSSAVQPNPAGSFLLAVNGSDGLKVFNGLSWSSMAVTGVDATKLSQVAIYMRRPVFIEKGTLNLWYLDVNAIGGPAHPIYLGPQCTLGGEVIAIAAMSMDGGRGENDRLIAVTSNGEVIVYSGVDPGKSETFKASGVFQVPQPACMRCLMPYGSDLAIATINGLFPLSAVISKPEPDKPLEALSDDIRNAYNRSILGARNSVLWGGAESALHRILMLNVPTHGGGSVQLVRSSDTGGWSSFSGLQATAWVECGNDLYFGDKTGTVYRLGRHNDDDYSIPALSIEAYSRDGSRSRKTYSRIRPVFDLPADAHVYMALAQDFTAKFPKAEVLEQPQTGWSWGAINWPLTPVPWLTRKASVVNGWRGISGSGVSSALVMAVNAAGPLVYQGSELLYQEGGPL